MHTAEHHTARTQRGVVIIHLLVVMTLSFTVLGGILSWSTGSIRNAQQTLRREQAFRLAEAGTEYYRWHLAHDKDDYEDGTGGPGPYVHTVTDRSGTAVGSFTLDITPPAIGSTLATIKSTGESNEQLAVPRAVQTIMAIPSLAEYAVVANDEMRFGEGTVIYGPVHSNEGIRFDGIAYNLVTSAVDTYKDPDHSGGNEFGVHTHVNPVDPTPPAPVPTRLDVFAGGRQFPVPAVDFTGITADLSQMKADAQADGKYLANSGALGYHIVLKINDAYDLYQVTTLEAVPNGCTNVQGQQGWGTWSIKSDGQTLLAGNQPMPANGLIFAEDHVWVDGKIDTARLTIVAGQLPDNPAFRKNIIVNNDLLYTNYDGREVLALIAQGNFNVGMYSEDDLRIDASLVAQNGRVGRHYYRPPTQGQNRCSPYHVRQVLTLYGMIGSNERYGFAYSNDTGYLVRNLNYDSFLLYGPPPSFPLTSDEYSMVLWGEVVP